MLPSAKLRTRFDPVLFIKERLHDRERAVRRAFIAYEPLYPTFQERLDRLRLGETAELFQRGAEQVVHNVGLYDTRRSSEDRSADFTAPRPEDLATSGPPEAVIDEEERSENLADHETMTGVFADSQVRANRLVGLRQVTKVWTILLESALHRPAIHSAGTKIVLQTSGRKGSVSGW